MTRRVALAAALAVLALPADPAAASIGPYTGIGEGLLDRYRHIDNHAPDPDHIVTDSKDVYRGRFRYSFQIDGFGNISGNGNGSYRRPTTWHLEGVNGSHGPFSCDISMTTTDFRVRVTGRADDGRCTSALRSRAHVSPTRRRCAAPSTPGSRPTTHASPTRSTWCSRPMGST